ncbi:MAG TPA: thioesterase domain-containing protein [Gemmataceae bacterium]|nr:thioesterase domain-containing protein [Gemmataceae bacterium]
MSAPVAYPPAEHTDVECQLAEIWRRVLEVDQVGPHDDLFRLGGDSLAAAEILAEIQKTFGRNVPLTDMFNASTVAGLAEILRRPESTAPSSALIELQPRGDGPVFYCVHGVGGEVLSFATLVRFLEPDQPLVGIRAAGADGYEEPIGRVEDMAARYVAAVRAAQPHGPYYLGGFSFGGSVALEMAQQLHAAGEAVAFLGIIDHTPPPLRYQPVVWTPARVVEFGANAVRWIEDDIWRAGRGQRLTSVVGAFRKAGRRVRASLSRRDPGSGRADTTEALAGASVPAHFRRLMATHYQALREYTPRPYPGHVTLFRARTRPLFRLYGRDLGWAALAGDGLDVIPIPGNHATILKEPNVRTFAAALKDRLRAAALAAGPERNHEMQPAHRRESSLTGRNFDMAGPAARQCSGLYRNRMPPAVDGLPLAGL